MEAQMQREKAALEASMTDEKEKAIREAERRLLEEQEVKLKRVTEEYNAASAAQFEQLQQDIERACLLNRLCCPRNIRHIKLKRPRHPVFGSHRVYYFAEFVTGTRG